MFVKNTYCAKKIDISFHLIFSLTSTGKSKNAALEIQNKVNLIRENFVIQIANPNAVNMSIKINLFVRRNTLILQVESLLTK